MVLMARGERGKSVEDAVIEERAGVALVAMLKPINTPLIDREARSSRLPGRPTAHRGVDM